MGYAFRSNLYWCIANGRVVFLDLAADRYLALPTDLDLSVQSWLRGETPSKEAFTCLLDRRVLVETDGNVLPTPIDLPLAKTSLFGPDDHGSWLARVQPWLVQLRMKRDLRTRPLINLVNEVTQAKALMPQIPRQPTGDRKRAKVEAYLSSRRLISPQDECLRWSLSMLRYLRQRHYYPNLVLGVRMMPFAAHAWVQDRDVVLSDTVEYVSAFTPILVA
jgi:hypothetical protein